MRVLVTGASGFVGRAALAACVAAGHEAIAASRSRPLLEGAFAWRPADLLDRHAAAALIRDCRPDVVVHLAWTVEHGKFWTSPDNLDWVAATLALARAAADAGVRRFVGAGTCFEYQWPADAPCREGATPLVPTQLYGVAKHATRSLLAALFELRAVEFAWARLFFMFGSGEARARLVPSIIGALRAGEPARCSSGRVVRDFLDVRDVGAAMVAVAGSRITGDVNIASGQGVTIADVARMLGEIAGRPDLVRLGALPDRAGEPPYIVADVARLRDEVGFRPSRTLREGLTDAWRQSASGEGRTGALERP